ncbi:MAG: aminopeptidase P family protein [Lachnospiraceae bacterium]|nr:aminopeptidase P family protein [Lachnospiraceae bacterium]
MSLISERIAALRVKMAEVGADWFFCTSDDFHGSEYVADYYKVREHFDGFTGENAFLMVGRDAAKMWTDGRFFIQAERELEGSGIDLMRMAEKGVPTMGEFLKENFKDGETLTFDGRALSTSLGKELKKIVDKKNGKLLCNIDIAGDLWEDRPALPSSKIFILSEDVAGESVASKLSRIREKMKEEETSAHFLTSLDDIMWITNLRANDIECNPVALSYLYITLNDAVMFLQESETTDEVRDYLESFGISLKKYEDVFDFLNSVEIKGKVLLDTKKVNYLSFLTLSAKAEVVDSANPSTLMKAIKNETEIARLKEAYIEDSVCVSKFHYWLKKNIGKIEITELSAADYIDSLRKAVPGFIELSFPTISGYGPNAAMMHYSATPESYSVVKPEGMLLIDSGGQYMKGTTDVTRTFACGPVTDEMKLHYSKSAAGMLALADAKFLYGCTGRNVDILARLPLWELGIDYKCGTGHGVGYILNVHEGPHNIRWKYLDGMREAVLEDGMIVSDEPGVYVGGSHGIRIENIILCRKDVENSDGQFMKFEHLTFAPLDKELLDRKYLSEKDVERINTYHKDVYDKTASFFEGDELEWLKDACAPM